MRHPRSKFLIGLASVEAVLVGLALFQALMVYLTYSTKQNDGLGPLIGDMLALDLTAPLAIVLPIAVTISAARRQRTAWVAATVLSVVLCLGVTVAAISRASTPL